MAEPNSFFTLESMGTLTGAAAATFIVSSGIQRVFNYNPKWLALLIAQLIAMGLVYTADGTVTEYLIGLVNGFLIYSTAVGGNSITGATPQPQGTGGPQALASNAGEPRGILTRWF